MLRGLPETLRRWRPAVLFEVLPNFFGAQRAPIDPALAAHHNARAQAIYDVFAAQGYAVHQVDRSGGWSPIDGFRLDDRDGFVTWDYLALPENGMH